MKEIFGVRIKVKYVTLYLKLNKNNCLLLTDLIFFTAMFKNINVRIKKLFNFLLNQFIVYIFFNWA